ncbi:MAG: BamA/TamA family outer membrane protein [Candidatus Aminicenantes bacterium]|nr:BamA/TamA family outer membrane protein [Candidatus Aminicenantes bacterium]
MEMAGGGAMKKKIPIGLISLSFLLLFTAHMSFGMEGKQKKEKKDKRTGVVILPIVFYQPETRIGAGGGGLITYRPKGTPEDARPSSLYFQAYYTQNKQYGIELKPELYLKKEAYLFKGKIKTSKFPSKYWGIGNQTPDEAEENYTPRMVNLDLSIQRRILARERLYLGLQYKYENYTITESDPDGELAAEQITGSTGGRLSSLGFILNWDRRDQIYSPHKGNYFQLTMDFYSPTLGSEFDFTSFKLDLRKYIPVFEHHVFAAQAVVQSVSGSPPFRHMSEIGGEMVMRGYYSGRYRDKSMLVIQTEMRFKVWKRIGMVVFAGAADLADQLGELSPGNFKYSAGLGLRILVVPKEGTNIRIDQGWGKGTSGFYIMADEAF